MRIMIFFGILLGCVIGGLVPLLWGNQDLMSPTSGFFSLIGSTIGLIVSIKIAEFFEKEEK